ncbi:MAG TPA: STAS domain-containing protein [Chthoniobacteraceae bacterium]|jgi:anti-sigma B factor antagonist|nr:STAS domain-containing protein [Chthoniobacteraceae bacterium]
MPEVAPAVISPQGELDLHNSPVVKEQLESLIGEQRPKVVVDLSDVSYIDSSGLAVFIEAMQRIMGYGGSFVICGLQENVRNIFSIARLDQVFRIFPDQSAALSA